LECPRGKYQKAGGKAYCDEVRSGSAVIMVRSEKYPEKLVPKEIRCPPMGVVCSNGLVNYTGGVWHGAVNEIPNCTASKRCTNMYTCINNGCPDEGASTMECKEGYKGPLCAICSEGYFQLIRDCAGCESPRFGELIGFILGVVVLIECGLRCAWKYRRFLDMASAFSRE
jgi:hypothetical protein